MEKEKKPGSWRVGGCYGGVLGIHSSAEDYNLDYQFDKIYFLCIFIFQAINGQPSMTRLFLFG